MQEHVIKILSGVCINPLSIMPQNGQTYFKSLAANAAKFLKCA